VRIYHNPRCSKSRETLKYINEKGVSVDIVEYLKHPPTKQELQSILKKLKMAPIDIVRVGELLWKEHYANRELSPEEVLDAIVKNPILLERPIVIDGDRAILGRPPENVLELL